MAAEKMKPNLRLLPELFKRKACQDSDLWALAGIIDVALIASATGVEIFSAFDRIDNDAPISLARTF
ncbi:hypothetical protein QR680_011655 [Steinernema hermaphroditum]|uniref:Uncharacterized protein n=1 Tax=Steinernema hermaphroditum TaxID=289476 RepID=A0AA39I1X3_9BILA|nr:hypothetical protein QR680_011655 [Steinernema hermaphroditum]